MKIWSKIYFRWCFYGLIVFLISKGLILLRLNIKFTLWRKFNSFKELWIFSEYISVSKNVSNVRKFGSAALDMAYVACGRFDGYWQRELNYWDIAAGIIILREAGGFVDFFEEDINMPLKKNILATNSNIHEELKELINKKDIE